MKSSIKAFSILGLSLALLGGAATLADKDKDAAKVGDAAPTWTAKDLDGKEWKSSDFAGKIVVLDWVNPGCPVCKGAHADGRIPGMIKELKSQDVVFLAVNSTATTTAEDNKAALKAYGVEYPVLLDNDGKIGRAFGAKTTPHVFVVDTKGVLRYAGGLDNGGPSGKPKEGALINYAVNAVKQIKANETVSPDSTPSYGCSVKYAKAAASPSDHDGHKH